MSVSKRSYRPYTGPRGGRTARFAALMRYGFTELWNSKITLVLWILCYVPALFSLCTIYVMNNDTVRLLLNGGRATPAIAIDQRFFFAMLQMQCWITLVFAAWTGPRLLSGELANNALPAILSRPITRPEYVLAKFCVLLGFLSSITWVPLLLLFAFQSHVSPTPWAVANLHIATGMLLGTFLWITVLSLVSLAVASWTKWRIVATGMIFAALFVPAGVGAVFNAVLRTDWGSFINLPFIMTTLWRRLLQVQMPGYYLRHELPLPAMLLSITLVLLTCIGALNARIRAREVVRG